ncbi:ribonuclease H-like domain-containing protein [Tanacetum coccineum]
MNSPPNYEWKQLLDIDDSDLPQTHVLRPCNSQKVIDDVGKDEDFKGGSRVSVVEFVNANGEGIMNGCLGDIENYLKNGKLEKFIVIIKSCTPNALGNLTMTLKDLLGTIPGTIHHKFIDEGGYGKDFTVGVTLIHVSGSGSGAGGSGILVEVEEIVKLMEKEMADLELQVYRNVIEQEDLYKFDKEALNLALEKEARQARAEHDWLEKCRQVEELDEEHERQLWGF